MNCYLVNPSEHKILENAGDRVPIGLLSIAANLRNRGHDVRVFDLNHTPNDYFFSSFMYDKPDVTGISVYTSPGFKEAVKIAKVLRGKTRLVAGGYHATALPESLLPYFDSIIKGEGESSFMTAMKKDGIIEYEVPNLDELPNPARDLLDMSKYGIEQSGRRTATLITSRGCPYNCAFCFNMERHVRFEPINKIKRQINQVASEGFQSIYFLDDVFTLDRDRMEEITNYAKEHKLPFRVTTRANLVDDSRLEILSKNGCEWLSLGIESGNNRILKNINKGMTTKDNEKAVELAHKYGIKVKGFFVIGLPGETERTAKDTINFSQRLKKKGLTSADFYYLTPFPGTPIWNNPEKFGIEITDLDYTKYLEAGKGARCYVNTKGLKAGRIEELVEEAREKWKKE
jgi:radical SAM superfamily enzyme YgiQ (UPF0313 family)